MVYAKEIKENIASKAWNSAHAASLFSNPIFLQNMGYKLTYIGGYKNEELVLVWPIINSDQKTNYIPPFSYYFGPFFIDNNMSRAPYKAYKNNLEVTTCVIDYILKLIQNVSCSLVPEFIDIRPFQWWNYDNPKLPQFHINVKYTARYFLNNSLDSDLIISSFRPDDKRKKIKKNLSNKLIKVVTHSKRDTDQLIELYCNTMLRTGSNPTNTDLNHLRKFFQLSQKSLNSFKIKIIEIQSEKKNELLGYQLLMIGKKHCYAIAQCVSNEGRKLDGNIRLTYESICLSKDLGCSVFDFNGANSPNRADDKHAFGAKVVPYYEVFVK